MTEKIFNWHNFWHIFGWLATSKTLTFTALKPTTQSDKIVIPAKGRAGIHNMCCLMTNIWGRILFAKTKTAVG